MEMLRKVIGIPLEKAAKASDGKMLVKGKFTSDSKDETGDIISRSATERALPKYRMWGNIRYMHQPKPVGVVTRIGEADGLEWNEVEINVVDPQAQFEVENGLLKALSVGILIKYEDVEMLEDGGWLINDYQLAEISLVDHPANYDAALELNLATDEALRNRVREQGVYTVLRDLGSASVRKGATTMPHPDENMTMGSAAEEIVGALTDAAAQEPVVEETVVEAAAEASTVQEEPPAAEEPVAEETPAPAEEAVVEATASNQPDVMQVLNGMLETLTALGKRVDEIANKSVATEQPVTVVESTPAEDDSAARLAALEAENKALRDRLTELDTPVNRTGALPVEELPVETPAEEPPAVEERPKNLREAVHKYMQTRSNAR